MVNDFLCLPFGREEKAAPMKQKMKLWAELRGNAALDF